VGVDPSTEVGGVHARPVLDECPPDDEWPPAVELPPDDSTLREDFVSARYSTLISVILQKGR